MDKSAFKSTSNLDDSEQSPDTVAPQVCRFHGYSPSSGMLPTHVASRLQPTPSNMPSVDPSGEEPNDSDPDDTDRDPAEENPEEEERVPGEPSSPEVCGEESQEGGELEGRTGAGREREPGRTQQSP